MKTGSVTNKNKRKRPAYADLPILGFKDKLLSAITTNQVTIVVGETGCGKSTQLPQYIADMSSSQKVICSQPRRVAAVTIAHRVAAERSCEVGGEVGYSIRFEDKSSSSTRIKYVTDGVLLREFMSDEALQRYNCIILDEAHERSLNTDILMGLLKQLFEKRSDMKYFFSLFFFIVFTDLQIGYHVRHIGSRHFQILFHWSSCSDSPWSPTRC